MAEQDIGLKVVDNNGDTKTVAVQDTSGDDAYSVLRCRPGSSDDWSTVVTCDADDSCVIPGIKFALRNSHCEIVYGFLTCSGLKGFKEYGNDLYGVVPIGATGNPIETVLSMYDEYCSEGDDPGFELQLWFGYSMVYGDTVEVYISESFEGPFTLFDTYDYTQDQTYIDITPPILGKRYFFKSRIIKADESVGYFSHYTVGMLPDYEEAPDFTGLTAYGASS